MIAPSELAPAGADALVESALAPLRAAGASGRVTLSAGLHWSVMVANSIVESVEEARSVSAGVTAFLDDGRTASATSTDLRPEALRALAEECVALARAGEADPCHGLPPLEECGMAAVADLSDDGAGFERQAMLAAFLEAERLARESADIVATDRSRVGAHSGWWRQRTTHGSDAAWGGTQYGMSLLAVAERDGEKQLAHALTRAARRSRLRPPAEVASEAARRAAEALGGRRVPSGRVRVIFDRDTASELLGLVAGLASGAAAFRGLTCWGGRVGERVASDVVTVVDDPLLPGEQGSRPCDDASVRSRRLVVVESGTLSSLMTDEYSARRLSAPRTGHAGGCSNLRLVPGSLDGDALLREMGTGLLVTELQGHGVELASGQWSKGVKGFWVEGGAIRHPVQGVTLAGRLQDMFPSIVAVGSDVLPEAAVASPSVLIDELTLGGA